MLTGRMGFKPLSARVHPGREVAVLLALLAFTPTALAAEASDFSLPSWIPADLSDPLLMTAALSFVAFACVGLGIAMGGALSTAAQKASAAARANARRSDAIDQHIDQELARILGLIRSHLQATGTYSNSLNEAHKSLKRITTPEQLRLTVEALILENESMRTKARDLDHRLDQARGQIDRLRSNLAEAEEISLKDPLTSLANRRSFDQSLQKEIEDAQSNRQGLCLVMGDIDHFKRINDTFGHLVGDAVLKRFAELLSNSVGGSDIVARFGGEEFAVILPGTRLSQALATAEGIRRTLESKKWVATEGGQRLGMVTASFGVAELHASDEPDSLVRRADAKLYEAKCSGRNKVVAEIAALA